VFRKRPFGAVINAIDDDSALVILNTKDDPVRKIHEMPDLETRIPAAQVLVDIRPGDSSSE